MELGGVLWLLRTRQLTSTLGLELSQVLGPRQEDLAGHVQRPLLGCQLDKVSLLGRLGLDRTVQHHVPLVLPALLGGDGQHVTGHAELGEGGPEGVPDTLPGPGRLLETLHLTLALALLLLGLRLHRVAVLRLGEVDLPGQLGQVLTETERRLGELLPVVPDLQDGVGTRRLQSDWDGRHGGLLWRFLSTDCF